MFEPPFQITPEITKALMEIEACRQSLEHLPLSLEMMASLRETARLMTTHYSTLIEGNLLTPEQVKEVIYYNGHFPGRERDETEVKNYYLALDYVEKIASHHTKINEETIKIIHGLVMQGQAKSSPYRTGQNVIRDSHSGKMVYMPPEAKDVQPLMKELVAWIDQEVTRNTLPIPLIAGIAHYQFATIHPYYDGNGRTTRLLTSLILHQNNYSLKGIYSLEEYYARNLQGYYEALDVEESHNYYFGRNTAEITKFLDYFCVGMAQAFTKVKEQALKNQGQKDQSRVLRDLTSQQRKALALFETQKSVTTHDIANLFSLSDRNASELCKRWLEQGFLETDNPSKKSRSYKLAPRYEVLFLS